jgi:hypothetical protein
MAIATTDEATTTLTAQTIADFRERLRGPLLVLREIAATGSRTRESKPERAFMMAVSQDVDLPPTGPPKAVIAHLRGTA